MTSRLGICLTLSAVTAIALTACSSGPQVAERLNRDANRQYATGNYGGALETYRRAEVLRPDLPALNYNTANTLNQQSDFQRALGEDQHAVQSTDPDVQDRAYYSMGNAFVRTNQLREAVDAYKSALRVSPADLDAKYNLEVIQRQLGQEEARRQQVQQPDQQGDQSQPGDGTDQGQQGQGQDGQTAAQPDPADSGQPGQASAGQGSQPSGATSSGPANGYTGTPAGQAAELDPALKRALAQFDQTGNVDDALRALDIAGQQEQKRQAGSGTPPQPQGRDW